MKVRWIALIALLAFGVAAPVQAADIAEGRSTAMFTCAECHGPEGAKN